MDEIINKIMDEIEIEFGTKGMGDMPGSPLMISMTALRGFLPDVIRRHKDKA